MANRIVQTLLLLGVTATPAAAQLGVPQVGDAGRALGGVLEGAGASLDPLRRTLGNAVQSAEQLADTRLSRLRSLTRQNRETIELDRQGNPARRGELLLTGASDEDVAKAQAAGFAVIDREMLDTLEISVVRLALPPRVSLTKGEANLRELLPDASISADTLHFQSGPAPSGRARQPSAPAPAIAAPVGMIDGAPGPAVAASLSRGFARGAPRASEHGSAVGSILRLAGVRRIIAADVYGSDPAGGNALAIARGLDWLTAQACKVVTISLVGPPNPLLARAVSAAQRRGVHIVAAVGNDGPAAPPAYPASYPGVIAVTGVDGRSRPLIEAGRATHLDYAAPAADLLAADASGRWRMVRGTSYATPFVAARAAAALAEGSVIPALDKEALDLGRKGPDASFGRGLLCASCARRR